MTVHHSSIGWFEDEPLHVSEMRSALEEHFGSEPSCRWLEPRLTILGISREGTDLLKDGPCSPEQAILGFHLPDNYGAIGVMAPSVTATQSTRKHREAVLALAVGRDGQAASMLVSPTGVITTDKATGWLIDACLRAVGRPTPPCTSAPLALPIALWLDRLLTAIVTSSTSEPLSWEQATELCPVPARWSSDDPIELGITLGTTTRSWSTLRATVAAGSPAVVGVSPAEAAWMDDAMFARWCLGSFPDLDQLRADVEFLAPPVVAERVELTVRAARHQQEFG